MESVQKQLEELGLSQNEVKAYLAALELGAATAQQIAAKAAVVRPTAYVAIGGLQKRGLMSSHTRGKKQYFQAERPGQLMRLVEEEKKNLAARESKLKSMLPGLEALISMAGEKPEVKYYEGLEGLQTMHQVLYESGVKHIDVIGDTRSFIKHVPDTIRDLHTIKMRKLGVSGREIYISDRSVKLHYAADSKKWKYKYWSGGSQQHVEGEISIFGDYIAMLTYQNNIFGFVIKNKATANLLKMVFDRIWRTL